jgi:glutamate-ammonia-ligase adenylyltransferase
VEGQKTRLGDKLKRVRHENEELAAKLRQSLSAMVGFDVSALLDAALVDSPNPDLSLVNLERWLSATASPAMQLEQLAATPVVARLLVMLLGAAQPIANSLIQNPELAALISDPAELSREPTVEGILAEGRRLLAASTSYTHSLDRLRFLRQRWTLPLVVNDLARRWDEDKVWRALSDLADALIALAVEVVWSEYTSRKELHDLACPLMVVAFGKLGGRELNYSSDVDLVYVCPDGLDEATDRHLARACEMLNKALSDRMGRGSLFRVDLRLRPFGGAGSLVQTMRSIESYYRSHAATWESQALLRSRPLTGSSELRERWEELRLRVCFRPQLSEPAVEEVLSMRSRIEENAEPGDLKRGAGGIRDVEFLTQVLQMIHGGKHASVRTLQTCESINELAAVGALAPKDAKTLCEGYRFLRQLEHRCQLVGDVQTHSVPESEDGRRVLARSMGIPTWAALKDKLDRHRSRIRSLYDDLLTPKGAPETDRGRVIRMLGPFGEQATKWFDALPENEAFFYSLRENQDSLARVRAVLSHAPALVKHLERSLSLTENVVSGEIEEEIDVPGRIARLASDASQETVAATARSVWLTVATQWALNPTFDVGPLLAANLDGVIAHIRRQTSSSFDVIALGSYALRDGGLASDADLLFLVGSRERHAEAEGEAQKLLATLDRLKRLGAPISIDLRLRPEGRKGLLVRTYDGFGSYELETMEMWERFAMGQARLVCGSPEAESLVLRSAYAAPLTPQSLEELLHMKRRIETERVPAQYSKRNVKLGYGGLSDIEWLVHLHEMRYPTATEAGRHASMEDRLRALERARLLNCLELDILLEARRHLLAIRNRLFLLGFVPDTIPENPDKLDRLAAAESLESGNAFLARHSGIIEAVRSVYSPAMERLLS